jgi:hypothetical protein
MESVPLQDEVQGAPRNLLSTMPSAMRTVILKAAYLAWKWGGA